MTHVKKLISRVLPSKTHRYYVHRDTCLISTYVLHETYYYIQVLYNAIVWKRICVCVCEWVRTHYTPQPNISSSFILSSFHVSPLRAESLRRPQEPFWFTPPTFEQRSVRLAKSGKETNLHRQLGWQLSEERGVKNSTVMWYKRAYKSSFESNEPFLISTQSLKQTLLHASKRLMHVAMGHAHASHAEVVGWRVITIFRGMFMAPQGLLTITTCLMVYRERDGEVIRARSTKIPRCRMPNDCRSSYCFNSWAWTFLLVCCFIRHPTLLCSSALLVYS